MTATVYSHAIKGRDREAARKLEEFQKKVYENLVALTGIERV